MIKMQVIGNLGRDATINQVNGKTVINFSVAHTDKYKKDGVDMQNTTWVECAYWTDRTKVAEYLKQGTQVHVEGKPQIDTYKTRDGQVKAKLTLRVLDLQLLGGKKEDAATPSTGGFSAAMPDSVASDLNNTTDDLPF